LHRPVKFYQRLRLVAGDFAIGALEIGERRLFADAYMKRLSYDDPVVTYMDHFCGNALQRTRDVIKQWNNILGGYIQ